MGKRNRLSKLTDSDEAFLAKSSRKQRSVAVSDKAKFDEEDERNMRILFETYDKYTGGRLRKMVEQNKLERALNNKDAKEDPIRTAERFSFFLPRDLQEEVEKYWPSLWTNKEHTRQFLKKFPMLRR